MIDKDERSFNRKIQNEICRIKFLLLSLRAALKILMPTDRKKRFQSTYFGRNDDAYSEAF